MWFKLDKTFFNMLNDIYIVAAYNSNSSFAETNINVLEAIENNVAVVCSNISPLNEFVANVSNCLVDRDNPKVIANLLEKFFKDNQKELKIVKKLQKEKIVKNFSIDKTAKKMICIIDALNFSISRFFPNSSSIPI